METNSIFTKVRKINNEFYRSDLYTIFCMQPHGRYLAMLVEKGAMRRKESS